MTIHWGSLLVVSLVSLSSTVAIVLLVSLALLGLSARTTAPEGPTRPALSPAAGTAVAGACLAAAALIVLFGLWVLVSR
jgi:hypothetical protein